jgi:hypothetical protein
LRKSLFISVITVVAATLSVAGAAPAAYGGKPLTTTLVGVEEVPGPGDPDASGAASLRLNGGKGEVCFSLDWASVDGAVVAAHIHAGAAGVAGPVVVPLFSGSFTGTDSVSSCLSADRELVRAIMRNPADYYVNLHSTIFPAGAVRGQLG